MMDQCRRDGTREGREATFGSQRQSAAVPSALFSELPASSAVLSLLWDPGLLMTPFPWSCYSLTKKSFVFFCHFSWQFQHLSFLYFVSVCLHRLMWVYFKKKDMKNEDKLSYCLGSYRTNKKRSPKGPLVEETGVHCIWLSYKQLQC